MIKQTLTREAACCLMNDKEWSKDCKRLFVFSHRSCCWILYFSSAIYCQLKRKEDLKYTNKHFLKEIYNTKYGKPCTSKTDEFSEKFQTAFDPTPITFRKSYCNFFPKFMTKVSPIMVKICNINFLIENDPPPPSELFRKFIRFGCVRHPHN